VEGVKVDDRGVGYLTDMLVFALLISLASLLLAEATPVDSRTESARYAASFAQSTLSALQHSTADEFGGFEYELDVPCFLAIGGSAKRNLRHKTLEQLVVEDALCNLHIEAGGVEFGLGPTHEMDGGVQEFLRGVLDELIAGRFGYCLSIRTSPVDLDFARVHFESEIKNFDECSRKLCSEKIVATLPVPKEELARRIQRSLGPLPLKLEPDLVVEITLELWSR
jgi:hypothetical protein